MSVMTDKITSYFNFKHEINLKYIYVFSYDLLFISKYWLFVLVLLLLCVVCLLCLISLFFRISCNAINIVNVIILVVKLYFRHLCSLILN